MIPPPSQHGNLFGARPGQTAWYMTAETCAANYSDREKLWGSVQQNVQHIIGKRYLPALRSYVTTGDLFAPRAIAQANPQHGEGGGEVIFIENYASMVAPVPWPQKLNAIEPPITGLRQIIDFEMSKGNKLDFVDHFSNGKLMGVYLTQPINFAVMSGQLILPKTIEMFQYPEDRFFAAEAGFLCLETKQYVTAAV